LLGAVGAPARTAESQAPAESPVAINGRLHVCGVKLCNQHGRPVQLRGMSTHGLQWYARCITDASLDVLAKDWRADVLRVAVWVQQRGYASDPRRVTELTQSIIGKASARGLYVIVDWHMLDPGDPFYNLASAKTFFADVARANRDRPNLLYEVANEPNGVNWERIKRYHEQIIPVIRAQDPAAVVLLGTRGWSSLGVSSLANESEVIHDPVNAANVMYTFHFYAASHGRLYRNTLARAAQRLPLFVTEFGAQRYTADGANDFADTQRYLDLMAARQIGWTNWNYSDDRRSGAVFKPGTCRNGTFSDPASLKESGQWMRIQLRKAKGM
jgi:endoglucanase